MGKMQCEGYLTSFKSFPNLVGFTGHDVMISQDIELEIKSVVNFKLDSFKMGPKVRVTVEEIENVGTLGGVISGGLSWYLSFWLFWEC